MESLLLTLLIASPAPNVTAGPDLGATATAVPAPIAKVTVYSDRAKVLRRGQSKLRPGIHALRLPDLPGAAYLDTVRVGATGAKVLRVETAPVERERWSIEQIEGQIEQIEALGDQLAVLEKRRQLPVWERNFLSGLQPAPPIPEKDRSPRRRARILPDVWLKVLGFLEARLEAAHTRIAKLDVEKRALTKKAEVLKREMGRHDLGAITDKKIEVLAIVEKTAAGTTGIELEYFVPGASWVPSYGLRFSADIGSVVLASAGRVKQATGEDWNGVELALSTAIPGRSIDMPELLTWTLGNQREWIPRPFAVRRATQATRLPPPKTTGDPVEAKRLARLSVLRSRMDELASLQRALSSGSLGGRGGGMAEGKVKKTLEKQMARRSRPRPQAAPPAPPATFFDFADDSVAMGASAAGAAPSQENRRGTKSRKDRGRVQTTSLSLYEPTYYRPPTFADKTLPAVLAGGLDYTYAAPAKATIPSRGDPVRVPLAVRMYTVTTFYEATPSLSKTAYLKATIKNDGERPVLAGRAAIFVADEFAGDTQLQTTGPGGIVELPLGADEDIRITHTLVPSTETEGLVSKEAVTTYTTTIEVGNYKKRAIEIYVVDQIPKARQEEVEVKLLGTKPRHKTGPDADGILRWKLKIAAGQTQKVALRYRLTRPADWKLRQSTGGRR